MRLSSQIFAYSAFNIVNAAVPFLLLPVLTAYLLPKEFGILSLVTMLQALLLPIVLLSFQGLVTIEYTRLTKEQFSKFITTILWLPVLGFLVVLPLLFIFSERVAGLFKISEFWVTASAVFVFLQALPMLMPTIFQARQQLMAYGFFKIGLTLLNIVFSLYFVICLKNGWEGRMWGMLGSFVVFNVISVVMLFREGLLNISFDKYYFHEAIKFGFPLVPHSLAGIMLAMADRLFLANLVSADAVGIYNVAYQIASAVMIVMSSINQAWVPHLYAQLNSSPSFEQKKKLVLQTYKIIALMCAGSLIFVAALPLVYHFFISVNYHEGQGVAMLISLAFLLQGFYFMATNYIFYVKKTYFLSVMTLISAGIVMLLNYLLIPLFGITGSAYSMVASWFILFALTWLLAHRVYPMPWRLGKQQII